MKRKLVRINSLPLLEESMTVVPAMYRYADTEQVLEFNPNNKDKEKGVIPGTRFNWWPEHYTEIGNLMTAEELRDKLNKLAAETGNSRVIEVVYSLLWKAFNEKK